MMRRVDDDRRNQPNIMMRIDDDEGNRVDLDESVTASKSKGSGEI